MYTDEDFVQIITRMARINIDFLSNSFKIKDEFPEIVEFIDQHKFEFNITSSFYNSRRSFTDLEALTIEKLFRDIFTFTLELTEPDESLTPEELEDIYEEAELINFLDDWYKTQGIKR